MLDGANGLEELHLGPVKRVRPRVKGAVSRIKVLGVGVVQDADALNILTLKLEGKNYIIVCTCAEI